MGVEGGVDVVVGIPAGLGWLLVPLVVLGVASTGVGDSRQ